MFEICLKFEWSFSSPCLADVGSHVTRKEPTMRTMVRRPFRGECSGCSHANDGRLAPPPPLVAKLRGPKVGRCKEKWINDLR